MTRAINEKPEIGLAAGGAAACSGGGDGRAALAGFGAERNGAAVRSGTIGGDGTSGVTADGCRSSCARRLLGELADDLRGGRLDHADAAAVLRDRTGQHQIGMDEDFRAATGRLDAERRRGIGASRGPWRRCLAP